MASLILSHTDGDNTEPDISVSRTLFSDCATHREMSSLTLLESSSDSERSQQSLPLMRNYDPNYSKAKLWLASAESKVREEICLSLILTAPVAAEGEAAVPEVPAQVGGGRGRAVPGSRGAVQVRPPP